MNKRCAKRHESCHRGNHKSGLESNHSYGTCVSVMSHIYIHICRVSCHEHSLNTRFSWVQVSYRTVHVYQSCQTYEFVTPSSSTLWIRISIRCHAYKWAKYMRTWVTTRIALMHVSCHTYEWACVMSHTWVSMRHVTYMSEHVSCHTYEWACVMSHTWVSMRHVTHMSVTHPGFPIQNRSTATCNTLQHTAPQRHTLGHTWALPPSTSNVQHMQHTASHCIELPRTRALIPPNHNIWHTATYSDTLQHTATPLKHNTLHAVMYLTHCNTLQHSATLWNIPGP